MTAVARIGFWTFVVVALLAPLLANEVPLVASVDGELRWPAFGAYVTTVEHGPDVARTETWKEWWANQPSDSPNWAVMTPWPYGPMMDRSLAVRNQPPTLAHPLGTDDLGRDLLMRLIWGSRTALLIGLGAVLLALAVGVPLGAWAGYAGGAVDRVLSLVIEVFLCFPVLFLALSAGMFFGQTAIAVIVVLAVVYWTGFARLVRGELLSLRQREFVLAARGLGLRAPRILLRHLLPRVYGPLRVNAAFVFASAIVVESTLSFLGVGPSGGTDGQSWGRILALSTAPALRGAWHLWLFPALAVVATVWCVHAQAHPPARSGR